VCGPLGIDVRALPEQIEDCLDGSDKLTRQLPLPPASRSMTSSTSSSWRGIGSSSWRGTSERPATEAADATKESISLCLTERLAAAEFGHRRSRCWP
jgi:hypothetical protein